MIDAKPDFLETIVLSGMATSNTEAFSFVKSGAIKINGVSVNDPKYNLESGHYLLQKGKNLFAIVVKK